MDKPNGMKCVVGIDPCQPTRYIAVIEKDNVVLTVGIESSMAAAAAWGQSAIKCLQEGKPEPPDLWARSKNSPLKSVQ